MLSHLPPKGAKIEGPVFWELTAVILMLCDRSRMQKAADGLFNLEESAKALAPTPALMDIPVPQRGPEARAEAAPPAGGQAQAPAPEDPAAEAEEATLPFDFETDLERFFASNAKKPAEPAQAAAEAAVRGAQTSSKSEAESGPSLPAALTAEAVGADEADEAAEKQPAAPSGADGMPLPPAPPEEFMRGEFCFAL